MLWSFHCRTVGYMNARVCKPKKEQNNNHYWVLYTIQCLSCYYFFTQFFFWLTRQRRRRYKTILSQSSPFPFFIQSNETHARIGKQIYKIKNTLLLNRFTILHVYVCQSLISFIYSPNQSVDSVRFGSVRNPYLFVELCSLFLLANLV